MRSGCSHGPPRVFSALPQFAAAILVVAATGLGAGVALAWIAAIAGVLVVAGPLRWARAAADLGRRRRAADEWLLWGAAARPSSALLGWRARELTSPRVRLDARAQPSRNRARAPWLEPSRTGPAEPARAPPPPGLVRALQERLEDTTRPVSVRGMVLADRLLTAPGSPLYSRAPDDVLAQALSEALAALDTEPLARRGVTPISLMLDAATAEPRSPGAPAGAAGRHPSGRRSRPPRPFRSASVVLAVTLLPAALWAAGLVPAVAALVFGAHRDRPRAWKGLASTPMTFAAVAASATRCFVLRSGQPPLSGLAAWRSDELTSPRNRRRLARRIRAAQTGDRSVCEPRLPTAAATTSCRWCGGSSGASTRCPGPSGRSGSSTSRRHVSVDLSPLFYPERAGALPVALNRALDALEPRALSSETLSKFP